MYCVNYLQEKTANEFAGRLSILAPPKKLENKNDALKWMLARGFDPVFFNE